MGEALISRAGGGEAEAIIPITPGYCSLLVTLKTFDGEIIPNASLNCKDGPTWYNYTTNEKGQCLFMCNSGSANISFINRINGIQYIDVSNTNLNIDAPVGSSNRITLIPNNVSYYQINSSKTFGILSTRTVNLHIVGGGGGGGGSYSDYSRDQFTGGGGGAGYMNNYINTVLVKGIYNFVAGRGGSAGRSSHSGKFNTSLILQMGVLEVHHIFKIPIIVQSVAVEENMVDLCIWMVLFLELED